MFFPMATKRKLLVVEPAGVVNQILMVSPVLSIEIDRWRRPILRYFMLSVVIINLFNTIYVYPSVASIQDSMFDRPILS